MTVKRRYTVEQANLTLPYVRAIVGDVRERYQAIQQRGRRHNALPKADEELRRSLKSEIRDDARAIHDCMCELEEIGIDLQDYEKGLVHFPTELDGRPILLTWQWDEPSVGYWHEMDDRSHGRRPVPIDKPAWPLSAAPAARG